MLLQELKLGFGWTEDGRTDGGRTDGRGSRNSYLDKTVNVEKLKLRPQLLEEIHM